MGDLLTPTHLIIVLAIALLVFGPKRLPELGSGLGKSLKAFREATTGAQDVLTRELDPQASRPAPAAQSDPDNPPSPPTS